jgi:hypothetical protein
VGEDIYLSSSSEVKGRYDYKKPKPKEFLNLNPLDVVVEISEDKVWALSSDKAVFVEGAFDKANDVSRVSLEVEKAFKKTGGTGFVVNSIEVVNNKGLFVPVSILNELRRKLLSVVEVGCREYILPEVEGGNKRGEIFEKDKYYLNFGEDVFDFKEKDLSKLWVVLPQICRNVDVLSKLVDKCYQLGARKFMVENYYGFEVLQKYKDVEIGVGSFIYVMNEYATLMLEEMGAKWCVVALESSLDNAEKVCEKSVIEVKNQIDYRPPLFTSAVCIRKNDCKNCKGGEMRFELKKDGRKYEAISKDCMVQVFKK